MIHVDGKPVNASTYKKHRCRCDGCRAAAAAYNKLLRDSKPKPAKPARSEEDTHAVREKRFWAKVDKTETCWNWIAAARHHGYGSFTVDTVTVYAHRFAYELLIGPIPDGLTIDHLCRNPRCVNPAHLEAVTHRENTLRGTSPSALAARKTHCIRGHEFTTENTFYAKGRSDRPVRRCRTCERAKCWELYRAGRTAKSRKRKVST